MFCKLLTQNTETLSDAEAVESKLLADQLGLLGQGNVKDGSNLLVLDKRLTFIKEYLFPKCVEVTKYKNDRIPPAILRKVMDLISSHPKCHIWFSEKMSMLTMANKDRTWDDDYECLVIGIWGSGKEPTIDQLAEKARVMWVTKIKGEIHKGISALNAALATVEDKSIEVAITGETPSVATSTW